MGVATILFDDGESAFLTDGFFSRPGLASVLARPIEPDETTIRSCLERAGIQTLDAVIPVHSHYDHALDSAVVARLTGAALVGGESTANIGRGGGLPPERVLTPAPGTTTRLGNFDVTLIESSHCPPDRFPGTIDAPLAPPTRVSSYRCGEAWSVHVAHRTSGRTVLVQGSAGFVPGALRDVRADLVYLGVGQLGLRPEAEIRQYWAETVRAIGARRAVLIHWDDFFRPLSAPLRATAYAADDLDVTMRVFTEEAGRDGVDLVLPEAWVRADPWA
jgi:L-ascorbate metabolism protein UlaG (beta-lactamase superfamily)